MKTYKYCKQCMNCDADNYFDYSVDYTNEEENHAVDFIINLDFIGDIDFTCVECGANNYCGELDWEWEYDK